MEGAAYLHTTVGRWLNVRKYSLVHMLLITLLLIIAMVIISPCMCRDHLGIELQCRIMQVAFLIYSAIALRSIVAHIGVLKTFEKMGKNVCSFFLYAKGLMLNFK